MEVVGEAARYDDFACREVDPADAVLHHRQGEARIELEHVVRDTRRDVGDAPERSAALLLDLEPDELEHVVRALRRVRERRRRNAQRRATRNRAVQADDPAATDPPRPGHPRRLAVDPELGAYGGGRGILARILDD